VRLLLITAVLLLVLAAPARAGVLIDEAAQGLASDNVFVHPDASPTLSSAEADALRERIDARGAGPMYIAVMPEAIESEAGGDAGQALLLLATQIGLPGTYALVSGENIQAGSEDVLPRGEAREARDAAIEAGGGDLDAILSGFVDRIGTARADVLDGGGSGGGSGGDGVGAAGGFILIGLLGVGGAALYAGQRRRRKAAAADFAEARREARDDLVSLGEGIRALDLDVQMPDADPAARADYERAVEAYTRADEAWEVARSPADLEPVGSALEEGRWAMASSRARFEGREPPERRPPCFFDPRHGPSARDVEWSPPYGEPRPVPACEADALRVEEGAEPATREVEYAGRRVPYWQAGPAYGPFAGGYFGGFGGVLPAVLIGSVLGGAMFPSVGYGDGGGFGDVGGGGDFGGGGFGGGDFGGGGFGGGGDF
jgi:hypothetical protein